MGLATRRAKKRTPYSLKCAQSALWGWLVSSPQLPWPTLSLEAFISDTQEKPPESEDRFTLVYQGGAFPF